MSRNTFCDFNGKQMQILREIESDATGMRELAMTKTTRLE